MEEDDGFFHLNQFPTTHMTVYLTAPQIAVNQAGGRSIARTPQSKLESFFDDFTNVMPLEGTEASVHSCTIPSTSLRKPGIVYLRYFNALAASAEGLYPACSDRGDCIPRSQHSLMRFHLWSRNYGRSEGVLELMVPRMRSMC